MPRMKTISCLACNNDVDVDNGARSAVCSDCMQKIVGGPAPKAAPKPKDAGPTLNKNGKPRAKRGSGKKYTPSGFPRGWHFKLYYKHTDGKVYSRGDLVKDKPKIKALEKRHG